MQNINGKILPEIGYHIAKKHQRKGYAAEATRACKSWLFANTPFCAVYSYMKSANVASAATARANGMRLVSEYIDAQGDKKSVYEALR